MKSAEQIAKEISILLPKFLRGMRAGLTVPSNITAPQLIMLLTIYEKGTCKGIDLSKELRISAPTVTGMIDRLSKAGYLKRIPDSSDRRVINIQLTKKGIDTVKDFFKEVRKRWKSILIRLSSEDRGNYLRILKRIVGIFGGKNE